MKKLISSSAIQNSRMPGHFRAGRHWSDKGSIVDLADFTEAQIAALEADPRIRISDPPKPVEPAKEIEDMTIPELKAYAEASGIDLGDAKKRDDIIDAILAD